MSGNSGAPSDPWAWLGLLKWSLSYTDGTKPSDPNTTFAMSDEDKAFLEAVMRDGIIDENERMKTILKDVTEAMDKWKSHTYTEEEEGQVQDLLDELRDIVEQIDYARAFAAMKGLDFLLGCVKEGRKLHIPSSIVSICLGIISTMAQNNPAVQKQLLELSAIGTLSDVFFLEEEEAGSENGDRNGKLRARVIQAISSIVRSYDLGESVFCQLDQSTRLIEAGLGIGSSMNARTCPILRKRTLFFLNALITSDESTRERVRKFNSCIAFLADNYLSADGEIDNDEREVREMALEMMIQILEQGKSVNAILSRKNKIVGMGVQRVSALRGLTDTEEREMAAVELEHWESLIRLIAEATPDNEEQGSESNPIMLIDNGTANSKKGLPQ